MSLFDVLSLKTLKQQMKISKYGTRIISTLGSIQLLIVTSRQKCLNALGQNHESDIRSALDGQTSTLSSNAASTPVFTTLSVLSVARVAGFTVL